MLIARTPVPLLAPCNGSFLLTADTSRLAATLTVNNAQAQCHAYAYGRVPDTADTHSGHAGELPTS